jgi:poly-gamma-glutamate synthesis protein (capsule biosynthesis protein)
VAAVGGGADTEAARAPLLADVGDLRLRLVSVTDHPPAYAASQSRPGVAFADLAGGSLPAWLAEAAAPGPGADVVVVLPHWGPNMQAEPVPHVRRAAGELVAAGATVVAGHSAHVFQGVAGRVLYDLGDFLDDYAVDRRLRNDLGLLWLVTLDRDGPSRIEALPLQLDYRFTRAAAGDDAEWIAHRLTHACGRMGTDVRRERGRLVITPRK